MNHDYKIGDGVQLTEGSVDMKVVNISADDVTVAFTSVSGQHTTATFHPSRIKMVQPLNAERIEAPVADAPLAEAPVAEAPTIDAPTVDAPLTEPTTDNDEKNGIRDTQADGQADADTATDASVETAPEADAPSDATEATATPRKKKSK